MTHCKQAQIIRSINGFLAYYLQFVEATVSTVHYIVLWIYGIALYCTCTCSFYC